MQHEAAQEFGVVSVQAKHPKMEISSTGERFSIV
jgi:hypothetical protein